MMHWLDDFLIDRVYQPAVDWSGKKFGWTQWGIARQLNYASLACSIIFNGNRLIDAEKVALSAVNIGLSGFWFVVVALIISEHQSVKDGSARFRASWQFTRAILAFLAITGIPLGLVVQGLDFLDLLDLRLILDVSALYCMACGDPPAKEEKKTTLATAGA